MNIQYSKTWEVAKAVFSGEIYATNIFITKRERFQINSLTFHHKTLEKESKLNLNQTEGRGKNKDYRGNC